MPIVVGGQPDDKRSGCDRSQGSQAHCVGTAHGHSPSRPLWRTRADRPGSITEPTPLELEDDLPRHQGPSGAPRERSGSLDLFSNAAHVRHKETPPGWTAGLQTGSSGLGGRGCSVVTCRRFLGSLPCAIFRPGCCLGRFGSADPEPAQPPTKPGWYSPDYVAIVIIVIGGEDDLADLAVKGGVIVAWGKTGIDDPESLLHSRCQIGVTSEARYHRVDPGKYTMAPYFAASCAQRILDT